MPLHRDLVTKASAGDQDLEDLCHSSTGDLLSVHNSGVQSTSKEVCNYVGEGKAREVLSCFHTLPCIETTFLKRNLALSSKIKNTYTLAQKFHFCKCILLVIKNDVCIRLFITVLFVIIKDRKQFK